MKFTDLFTNRRLLTILTKMICFVCIEDAVQTLAIFGNGEINSKIAVIIEKHLNIKPQISNDEALEICHQCWEKLRDFNDFFEHVAKVHNEQKDFVRENFFTDTGGDEGDEKSIWEPNIKTETLEDTLDNNVELHFFETDGVLTKNPLLDLVTEEDNDIEDILSVDADVRSKKNKNRPQKTRKSKKINSDINSPESADNNPDDNDNEGSVGSVMDDIKNEESEETSDANNDFKNTVEKKKKQKRASNRSDGENFEKSG
ncbi:hypothetical protein DOY81_015172 [Sarcophaga bullata]|nr:hypothetical protein DOY81_015172 [Sarcophaga bullata]